MISSAARLFRLGPVIFDAIISAGSSTSLSINLQHISRIVSVMLTAISATGTSDVKLEYAVSHNDSTYGSFDDYADIIASSVTEFVTDEGFTVVSMPEILAPFVKFKMTGVASNPADTIATMYLLCREGG